MAGRRTFVLGLAVAVTSAGCGTMDNVKRPTLPPPNNPDAKVCRVYGGLRGDFTVMTEFQWSLVTSYLDYAVIPLLAGTDLALDVFGDTLTLPYTLAAEARRALQRDSSSAPPPIAAPEGNSAANPESARRGNGP